MHMSEMRRLKEYFLLFTIFSSVVTEFFAMSFYYFYNLITVKKKNDLKFDPEFC